MAYAPTHITPISGQRSTPRLMVGGVLLALAMLAMTPSAAVAQRAQGTPGDRGQQGQVAGRSALESQLEQRLAEMVQRELKLTDEQMRRVAEVNRRIDTDRRAVLMRERRARMALRSELDSRSTPSDARVSALIDEMMAVQQERLRLTRMEQQALAEFLTPVQRARYLGLQESFRRRMEARRHDADRERRGRATPGAARPGAARPGAARPSAPPSAD